MIRCLAIDDEPLALELLEDNISKLPYLQLVASCDNALDAIKVMEQESIDLIFLDIQMPGLTGLQFIETLATPPMIILVTAYEQYALDGFNLAVTDYLVKPVSLERFIKACNKARDFFELKKGYEKPIALATPGYFFVNVDYSMVKIVTAEIIYIEGLKDYIKIFLDSAPHPVVTRMPLKTMEEQLPASRFLRIHKSYIVSIAHVTAIRKSSVFIKSLELPLSDNYREAVNLLTGKQSG